ncbi:MAG: type II toxin-antitoxin system RelE/ParE family toxin [Chthoniobacteraceae bacterium]|jgi:toxin ParE1/3/4
MPRIIRTRESRSDFDNIWAYIAVRNLDAADGVVRKLDSTLNLLASAPEMGRKVEELGPNLRSFPVGSYLIFYRPIDDGIQLIRVIHGAREITPEYFPEE